MPADITEGMRITVSDARKKVDERIIAQGKVNEISKQGGWVYIYLDTGYCLIIEG